MTKVNTNTQKHSQLLDSALTDIPKKFRDKVISSYLELKNRYKEAQYDSSYDAAGLSAGKFCESVLRFLQQELTGTFIPFGSNINNFPDECRKLIILPKSSGNESLRIIIPRALVFLYTLRGKRGIGHVGGDIEANEIDLATIIRNCDWVISELIRIYYKLPLEEAQTLVDILATRNIPDIWNVAGKKRILRTDLNFKQKALLLAYSELDNGILIEDLFNWVEHSNLSMFKRSVIKPLHDDRFIEYDNSDEVIFISPKGVKEVEDNILERVYELED